MGENEQSDVIREAESRERCVRAERGRWQTQHCVHRAGMFRLAHMGSPTHTAVSVTTEYKKMPETQHAEPNAKVCRTHFKMNVPHYVTLWHHSTRVSNTVTTFNIVALL